MIYLVDTDTVVYTIRGLKSSGQRRQETVMRERADRIVERCKAAQKSGDTLGISAITVSELEYGARRSGKYEDEIAAVQKILVPFTAYDYDAFSCAYHYGRIRRDLEQNGQTIGALDMLIAAQAVALEAILITNNEEYFGRVHALTIENWSV